MTTDIPRARPSAASDRIRSAARTEFARHGLAGARVDRIAAAAGLNKERLYAHVGDKNALFVVAIASAIQQVADFATQQAEDLPDLAGRMFDVIGENPDMLRLFTWARLEAPEHWESARALVEQPVDPASLIAGWQSAGIVDPSWHPQDVFIAVLGLCEIWHVTPFAPTDARLTARRRALVAHVAASLAPPPAAS